MSLDLRTRRDDDVPVAVDPVAFFSTDLPALLERSRALLAPGTARLALRPLTFEIGGDAWTLVRDATIQVRRGSFPGAARVRLGGDELTRLMHDLCTPVTFHAGGTLDMPAGELHDFLDWWLVLRGALDGRPPYAPGSVTFAPWHGTPLDLRRTFTTDDPRDEMAHFLAEAGYLHLAALFTEAEMAEIAADMDRAASSYREGDGLSWWATTAGGQRQLVRMQAFDQRSPAAARLLNDERLLGLGTIPGDGHVHTGLEGNRIEALVKPIGVVAGISDVPWHKDCSLGRHSYECCSLTVGISVTGADARSGQLRVAAGSHRALVWPARLRPGHHDLPEIDLPTRTGDVTVHLSCTLHMSQPPEERERRVMYTSFRLPPDRSAAAEAGRARVRAVREKAPGTVSQEPGHTR